MSEGGGDDWAEWWRTVIKTVKWTPEEINEVTFAQLVAVAGSPETSGGKIAVANFDELRPHIEAYLDRERPENALREAEEMLAEEMAGRW